MEPIPLVNASIFQDKSIGFKTVVGITCCLSIIGSILIIISYLVQKKRTKAREILAHISLMDLGVGLANLIGMAVYFNRFYYDYDKGKPIEPAAYVDNLCKTQAFFAAYCTLGSIFWTTSLAAYLYIVILHYRNPKHSIYFVRFCYFLCYGMAFVVSLWLILTHRLGYSPYDSSGWCSLITKDPYTMTDDLFVRVFSHDLWMYLTIILIVIFYMAIRGFLSNRLKVSEENQDDSTGMLQVTMKHVDYKFILIPVMFILLRMWSCLRSTLVEYAGLDASNQSVWWKILLCLSGIGDSGQGFTNAILFIFFTKSVRNSLMGLLCCKRSSSDALRYYQSQLESTTTAGSSPASLKRSLDRNGVEQLYESGETLFQSVPEGASVNRN